MKKNIAKQLPLYMAFAFLVYMAFAAPTATAQTCSVGNLETLNYDFDDATFQGFTNYTDPFSNQITSISSANALSSPYSVQMETIADGASYGGIYLTEENLRAEFGGTTQPITTEHMIVSSWINASGSGATVRTYINNSVYQVDALSGGWNYISFDAGALGSYYDVGPIRIRISGAGSSGEFYYIDDVSITLCISLDSTPTPAFTPTPTTAATPIILGTVIPTGTPLPTYEAAPVLPNARYTGGLVPPLPTAFAIATRDPVNTLDADGNLWALDNIGWSMSSFQTYFNLLIDQDIAKVIIWVIAIFLAFGWISSYTGKKTED